jgi:hypothetical protein
MKRRITVICIFSFLLYGLASGQSKPADKTESLKVNLKKATIKAIGFEIERFKSNPEKLKYFSEEKKKYEDMKVVDYKIPQEIGIMQAYVSDELRENGQIYFKKQSRSGPFYCVSGIVNNNKKLMIKGKYYAVKAYLVYKREYMADFKNFYIYIDSAIR